MSQHNIMIPAASSAAYDAARRRAAFVDRSDRGRITVAGKDRASYLHALFTNDIVALKAGQGCYAAYLTPQGRMITDVWVYQLGDVILLTMGGDVRDALLARLDQLIFSEDVRLEDVTETFAQVAVVGPQSAAIVAGIITGTRAVVLSALGDHENVPGECDGGRAIVTRVTDLGEPGFELYFERRHLEAVTAELRRLEVAELDGAAAEAIRIEAGVPRFHRDMDEGTIPLEAGIESRAISQTKGCYVGQEVIVRVLHRGHGRVARRLVGLRLHGAQEPASGAVVTVGDREAGRVTSAAFSPALRQPIALAYLHRDFVEPGTQVSVAGTAAEVTALPFV
jgi:folate-binding protein YgfZ